MRSFTSVVISVLVGLALLWFSAMPVLGGGSPQEILVEPEVLTAQIDLRNAENGIVYGPSIRICSVLARFWEIVHNDIPLDMGFMPPRRDIQPGECQTAQLLVRDTVAAGRYHGAFRVRYLTTEYWLGPTVVFTIVVTATPTPTPTPWNPPPLPWVSMPTATATATPPAEDITIIVAPGAGAPPPPAEDPN